LAEDQNRAANIHALASAATLYHPVYEQDATPCGEVPRVQS